MVFAPPPWHSAMSMPDRRSYFAAAQVGADIYVGGGMVGGTGSYLLRLERFDPRADTWTREPDLPGEARAAAGAALRGKFYVVGGQTSKGVSRHTYAFDPRPITGRCAPAPLPAPRYNAAAAALNGTLYVAGGVSNIDSHGRSVERSAYSTAMDSVTRSDQFVALGHAGSAHYAGLETFPNPGVSIVELTSDELVAVCPITGQPDMYTASIEYTPGDRCLESKSLKLYLSSFRNEGVFCEALAVKIRDDVAQALGLDSGAVRVCLTQKARGGITIAATA